MLVEHRTASRARIACASCIWKCRRDGADEFLVANRLTMVALWGCDEEDEL